MTADVHARRATAGIVWARAVWAEWGKALSVRAPAVWIGLAVVTAAGTTFSLANDALMAIQSGDPGAEPFVAPVDVITPGMQVAQISLAAFAIHLMTPEYASESIRPTILASPRRWPVVTAKATVAMAVAALVGGVLGPGLQVAMRVLLDGHVGPQGSLWSTAVGTAAMSVVAASLGVAVGVLTRSAVPALCLSVLVLLVSLAVPHTVGRVLPGPAGSDLMARLAAGGVPSGSAAVLAAWTVLPLIVATRIFGRRDA